MNFKNSIIALVVYPKGISHRSSSTPTPTRVMYCSEYVGGLEP